MTTPCQGTVCNPNAKTLHMVNQCTKFEVSHFRHSRDILWGTMNLNGCRDYNHAPLGGSFPFFFVILDIAYLI